jgi:hypothetical protein
MNLRTRRTAITATLTVLIVLVVFAAPALGGNHASDGTPRLERVGDKLGVFRGVACTGSPNDDAALAFGGCVDGVVTTNFDGTTPITFPADTPFHIEHGWDLTDAIADFADTEWACLPQRDAGDFTVELYVDGKLAGQQVELNTGDQGCWVSQWWIRNYRKGLTGTHVFQLVFHWPEELVTPFGFRSPLVVAPVEVTFTTP